MLHKNEYINIPKLYKRQSLDLLMFGFVMGMQTALPSLSLRDCIVMFKKCHNLSEDDLPYSGARVSYYRMLKEFKDVL